MTKLPSKLPHVRDTIFSEMNALAQKHQAINLGQGFPDFPPDDLLIQSVCNAMHQGHNQYAPMIGIQELRETIASKVMAQHGRTYDEQTEITVTSGASEALTSSLLALVHPGDEVVLIDPAYDLYAPVIELAGARPVRVAMQAPTEQTPLFQIDWGAVTAVLGPKTRLLVLNFPHNPSGLTLKDADLDALEQLMATHSFMLLSDEAYEHIVFDGEVHRSPIQRPFLAQRCVLVSSFGKTLHATGWKIGYCCAPASIMQEIRKVHQYAVFSVSTPMQKGIATYLQTTGALSLLSAFYQKKRDRLIAGLQGTALIPLKSEGTFFLLVQTHALGPKSEKEMAIWITAQAGVACIPVSAFYASSDERGANHGLLRLCFAKQDATLDQAAERLQSLRAACGG